MSDPSLRKGSPVQQFSIMLENRAGALSSIVRLLHERLVEVLGLSLTDSAEVTLARVVVSDPDLVMQIFLEKGISHALTDVVVVELEQGAAGLSQCLDAIAQGETNMHFSYPLFVRSDREQPLVVMYLEDAEFATAMLQQQGFRVLCQEDLSR